MSAQQQQQQSPAPRPSSATTALTSPSNDPTEQAFVGRRSRVLLVCGLPPDQANQHDLRAWLANRLGDGSSSEQSLGILGVCAHTTRSRLGARDQATNSSDGDGSWWIIFQEHHLARDVHRRLADSLAAHSDLSNGVTVGLALEEDLAPLDGLKAMPLVRSPPEQQQEQFPTHFADDSSNSAGPRPEHDRTPSLSFSSTSSASSTHARASPASQHAPDLSSPVRTRASALSLNSRFDVEAKPFFPQEHAWSTAHAGSGQQPLGEGDDGASRRPDLGGRSQSLHGLGFSTGESSGGFGSVYDDVGDLGLSSLGLAGTAGGSAVSFRQGDWICPSDTCSFHNFSRNEQCMICATAKPPSSSSRSAPRPDITTPTPQRPPTVALPAATPQMNYDSPPGHLSSHQQQALQNLATARNVSFPPHLTQSSPATFHTLPNRPLMNSVSLPDIQGANMSTPERARRVSTLSSPGYQMSPLPPQQPTSAQGSPLPLLDGGLATWPRDLTTTPSPMAQRHPAATSYFSGGDGGNGNGPGTFPPPAALGLSGVRGRSMTFAGGSGAVEELQALGRPALNGPGTSSGHRATLSLGGGSVPAKSPGERMAPIVNSGNTGPMTIQQGDWACGTCGFVNWRRRRVCLKCFPFAEGNELAGSNLAASVMLVTQLAQAPSTTLPPASATPTPPATGNYQNSPFRGPAGVSLSAGSASRSFISSGPFRPPPGSDIPNGGQQQQRDCDVFGLVSPVHSPPTQQASSFGGVGRTGSGGRPTSNGGGWGEPALPPLSPIGAEVRSFAGAYPAASSSSSSATVTPHRPPPISRSSSALREVAHHGHASEGPQRNLQ